MNRFIGIAVAGDWAATARRAIADHKREALAGGRTVKTGTGRDTAHAGIGAEVVYGGAIPRAEWQSTRAADYQVFCNRVAAGEAIVLAPYGAEAPDEFFAVASEALFVLAPPMKAAHRPCTRC